MFSEFMIKFLVNLVNFSSSVECNLWYLNNKDSEVSSCASVKSYNGNNEISFQDVLKKKPMTGAEQIRKNRLKNKDKERLKK